MAKVLQRGVRMLDFEDDQGKAIQGFSVYIEYVDPSVTGVVCEKKFISRALADKLGLDFEKLCSFNDKSVDVDLNIKGKIENWQLSKE